MQLKLNCSICQSKRQRLEDKLTASTSTELLPTVLAAIPALKPITIKSEIPVGNSFLVTYSCGHSILESNITKLSEYGKPDIPRLTFEDTLPDSEPIDLFKSITKGYSAYKYQREGVDFVKASNYNCLIADEMALGKTVQALLALRDSIEQLSPCIIIVPSSTIYQWVKQFNEWATQDGLGISVIISSKTPVIPIFKTYIISMDLLADKGMVDKILALKPKLVIADEVQSFKNPGSARSQALVKLIQTGNIQHKIFLSGTPIKNRAGEYFTILNLLAPGHFPSWRLFVTRWLEPELTASGATVYRRLRKYAVEDFRNLTSRWIIRRETSEVQSDLPPIRYQIRDIQITDPLLKKSYNQQLDLFANWLNDPSEKKSQMGLLGWLAKMRHETANAKVQECTELAKEFLDSTEEHNTKLAIGIHHKDVRDILHFGLQPYGALKLSGEDNAQAKEAIKNQFQESTNRVLVINELSGGVGMDGLQVCNNVFILEPQWSPSDEDQFVKRFNRDSTALINDGKITKEQASMPTLVTSLIASGTIDEFFEDMKADKRSILKDAYGNWSLADDTVSLMDLARTVVEHRL